MGSTRALPLPAVVGAISVELSSALPACSFSKRGTVYYVQSEIQVYYCDGRRYRKLLLPTSGAAQHLCSVEPASPGACAGGGVAITTGVDRDGDDVLDPNEVASTEYLCDGVDGSSCSVSTDGRGLKTIQCTDGTSAVISDGADGEAGVSWVVSVGPVPTGVCATGGSTISAGPDEDQDGMPDSIRSSQVVCNGELGPAGPPGPPGRPGERGTSAALRTVRFAMHAECPVGGVLVEAGIDRNDDSVLEDDEVQSGEVICDGEAALLERLVVVEPGAVCEFGGERRDRGLDTNDDGALETAEVVSGLSVLDCFVPSASVGAAVLGIDAAILRARDLESPTPRLVRYRLDFGAGGIRPELLSARAREALPIPPTSQSVRIAYAIDLLRACCGAELLELDAAIDYLSNAGEHTDLRVEIQGRKAAVAVLTANIPLGGVTPTYAQVLWPEVLGRVHAAQANFAAADAVDKSIVVMFVSGVTAALIVDNAYQALSSATRADTLVVLVQTDVDF